MILLATLLSLAVAVVVVRTGLIYSLGSGAAAAASFAPDHPRVLVSRIDRQLAANKGLVTEEISATAHKLLRRAPMLEEPMLVGGIAGLLSNNTGKARQLISHALARNPRSELARLLMLELDLRANDANRAVVDMTVLSRLMPDVHPVFVPELARMARDPRTSSTLAPTLRSNPTMLANVLFYLSEHGASARQVLALAGSIPTGPPTEDVPDWRSSLLRGMVARGEVETAHRLWAAFSGIEERPLGEGVYDGSFRGRPGLAPFNWTLTSSEIGAAEREKVGGLHVEYYGREAGELATQLIALAPGRYRLAFRAEGDIHDPQHRLFWRVFCTGADNAALINLPIANISFAGRVIAGDFSVPVGCSAQWLKLVAEPTEFPKVESLTVRQIRIMRLKSL